MSDILDEIERRRSLVEHVSYEEANTRISGFYDWLRSQAEIEAIIIPLEESVETDEALKSRPPNASSPEVIAGVGIFFMSKIADASEFYDLTDSYGILPPYQTSDLQDEYEELMSRYITPAIDYIQGQLEKKYQKTSQITLQNTLEYPPEILFSLKKFEEDYPHFQKNGFIMMRLDNTKVHEQITKAIRSTLGKFNLNGLRADDKEYHDGLFENVLTYMYGCGFGIAVFERLEEENFNPNVALEVGYMRALHKSVCLLKDKTIKTLPADLTQLRQFAL